MNTLSTVQLRMMQATASAMISIMSKPFGERTNESNGNVVKTFGSPTETVLMAKRHKMSRRASKKSFTKAGVKTHKMNMSGRPMRGGGRL